MDLATIIVPEQRHKVGQRGLAGAGGADQGGHGFFPDAEIDVAEHVMRAVGEADV